MKTLVQKCMILAGLGAIALAFASCSSSPYSTSPPGRSSVYMGVSYYDGFYGGPWYGPGYRPPTVIVPPRPPRPPINRPMPLPAPVPRGR